MIETTFLNRLDGDIETGKDNNYYKWQPVLFPNQYPLELSVSFSHLTQHPRSPSFSVWKPVCDFIFTHFFPPSHFVSLSFFVSLLDKEAHSLSLCLFARRINNLEAPVKDKAPYYSRPSRGQVGNSDGKIPIIAEHLLGQRIQGLRNTVDMWCNYWGE